MESNNVLKIEIIKTELEILRKKKLIQFLALDFGLLAYIIIVFFYKSDIQNFLGNDLFLTTFMSLLLPFAIGLVFYLPFHFDSGFKSFAKKNYMEKIISLYPNLNWARGTNILKNEDFAKSTLFSSFNTVSIDDSFSGEYKGVKFKAAETTLSEISQGKRSRSIDVIFNGVVIAFAFPKKIKAKTTIFSKGDFYTGNYPTILLSLSYLFFILLGLYFYSHRPLSILILLVVFAIIIIAGFLYLKYKVNLDQEVILEDSSFAKKFKVFSQDQIEARYLVTTAFMERLLNLSTVFGTKKIKCSFYDNKIMIAITVRRNLFELGNLFVSYKKPKTIKTFFAELEAIYSMIEYFKLDEKTML